MSPLGYWAWHQVLGTQISYLVVPIAHGKNILQKYPDPEKCLITVPVAPVDRAGPREPGPPSLPLSPVPTLVCLTLHPAGCDSPDF